MTTIQELVQRIDSVIKLSKQQEADITSYVKDFAETLRSRVEYERRPTQSDGESRLRYPDTTGQ